MANGDAFLTKPEKTVIMVKIIKKITNINPNQLRVEPQMQDL